MKANFIKSVMVMSALAISGAAFAGGKSSDTRHLQGEWQLSRMEVNINGAMQTVPFASQIIITDKGTIAVQARDPNNTPTPYSVNGYEAYYGKVQVNPREQRFSVQVQSSLAPALVGQTLQRQYQLNKNELVLTPVNANEGWRATYRRQ